MNKAQVKEVSLAEVITRKLYPCDMCDVSYEGTHRVCGGGEDVQASWVEFFNDYYPGEQS